MEIQYNSKTKIRQKENNDYTTPKTKDPSTRTPHEAPVVVHVWAIHVIKAEERGHYRGTCLGYQCD